MCCFAERAVNGMRDGHFFDALSTRSFLEAGVHGQVYSSWESPLEADILRLRSNFIRLVWLPGMEREYSWSFVPFHAGFGGLCPIEILGNRHWTGRTQIDPTGICLGTVQLDSKTGVPSRGQRVILAQRIASHANGAPGMAQSRQC